MARQQNKTPQLPAATPVDAKTAWKTITAAKKVLLSLHTAPDGDSLSSCVALKYVLERDYKTKVTLISADSLDAELREHRFAKEVQFGVDVTDLDLKKFDLIVVLDANSADRFGKHKEGYLFPKEMPVIIIDHHQLHPAMQGQYYSKQQLSSSAQVLLELLKVNNVLIDAELANRLILGIATDSGFFTVSDVNGAIKDAGFLIDKGANYTETVARPLIYEAGLTIRKIQAYFLLHLVIDEKKKRAYSVLPRSVSKSMNIEVADIRHGIASIQNIKGIDIVFTLAEIDDKIKGSLRSKQADISKVARALGGGGHIHAAAFYLPLMPLDDAVKKVLKTIDDCANEK